MSAGPGLSRRGFFHMKQSPKEIMITPPIYISLVEQVVARIPEHTWEDVRTAIITNIVDAMPSDILMQLTDAPDDFDRAEEILYDYYELPERKEDLIIDAFKILGEDNTLYMLDALQLEKIQAPQDDQDN